MDMENATAYGDAGQCLQAARANMRRIKELLAQPSAEAVDESAAILHEVEVQLGCVAALLQKSGLRPDLHMRTAVEDLQEEVAVLAKFLSQADRMLAGWLQAVQTKRGGYTERGQAAPLVLVKKQLTVEG